MSFLVAVSITVGLLAGLWTGVSTQYASFGLITFVGFLSWASFYADGGKVKGLKDSLILNFSGVVWAWIIVIIFTALDPVLGTIVALSLAVTIGAAAMCMQAHFSFLSFIPGAFIGCSAYFATGFNFTGTVLSLVIGALLGYVSEYTALALQKATAKK